MAPPISAAALRLLGLVLGLILSFTENGGLAGAGPEAHTLGRDLYGFRPSKMFVFGDSYADTGNTRKTLTSSWKEPYGITFPGKPAGRFSDGRVLTDYIARFVGIKTPIPYRWMNVGPRRIQYGVNFAYGGTGVFQTSSSDPNMTAQIDFMQNLLNDGVYTWNDLQSSVALVTLSGNDYAFFIANNNSTEALQAFIPTVVNQLVANIQRVQSMGLKKVVVSSLQPLGCLPRITVETSYQSCNAAQNAAVQLHNLLLEQAVAKLNNNGTGKGSTPYVVLDLYSSFMSVLQNNSTQQESVKFRNPLKLCCAGTSSGAYCGTLGADGEKMYTVCDEPEASFFWDTVHPTQEGWRAVYIALQATLKQNLLMS
uniref:GDSL esterase/lipase n=1 Tax=Kalanchoe fedtschenkoi TaxID=63787 RepID=A0A7N0UYY6_KALFE